MEKRTFYKVLSFEKTKEGKVGYFTDNRGVPSQVRTTWGGVIPGLRYSCKLVAGPTPVKYEKAVQEYVMVYARLWEDALRVESDKGVVNVMLDDKPVEVLYFDVEKDPDFESKVEELRVFFREKTFQLRSRESIDSFVQEYEKECRFWYRLHLKDVKSESKKIKKFG